MDTVTKKIRLTPQVDLAIDDILNGIADLDTADLEQFLQKVGRLVARKKTVSLSERETILLQAINQIPDITLKNRYDILSKKQNKSKISTTEHEELLLLIDVLELQQAKRLENLIELAHLRSVSLETLMQQLNLNFMNPD
jgi:hypothetical protein